MKSTTVLVEIRDLDTIDEVIGALIIDPSLSEFALSEYETEVLSRLRQAIQSASRFA